MIKTSAIAVYGGSAGAVLFGLTAGELAALGGLVIGVIGLAVNAYFKHQHLKLAKSRHRAGREIAEEEG